MGGSFLKGFAKKQELREI